MDLGGFFPKSVSVTDQQVDESSFSTKWKQDVVSLGERIVRNYVEQSKERYIVAFGGASGSGKSTAAKTLEHLIRSSGIPATAVGQDGYHFAQEYLLRTLDGDGVPLAQHKGRYDSFDVPAMRRDLERFIQGDELSFPEYSRKIHDPLASAIRIEGPTLLIFEGLWLLYDHAPWNELLSLYDMTVFFNAEPEVRMRNTITRHIRGNEHPPHEAGSFYKASDEKNAEIILSHIAKHDVDFSLS